MSDSGVHHPDLEAGADAPLALQTSSVNNTDGHPRPFPTSYCAIIVKLPTAGYKLHPILLTGDMNGVQVMTMIRCHVLPLLRAKGVSAKFRQFFTKIEVGTGTVQGVSEDIPIKACDSRFRAD